ncbi:uncharacterized protein LOC128720570 [Anopheles nili]|uniref:uncharacterized protein LOC128720570 n=1 Tax=Anopheles nili TaxID=185578 RepID=UPI00237AF040|nr:uncharacterized protein LOC128720570 [Anopheles nili]
MSAQYNKGISRRNIDTRNKSFDNTVGSDDDDDSDTLTELSRESLTSSQDRSSIGSIPWAEDAIKQNQIEWERIDRMFYGEEDLPSDPKLREEIIEWTSVFPFLRVTGKSIVIVESPQAKGNDPFHDEVFVVDPPLGNRSRSSRSGRDGQNKQSTKDIDCVFTSGDLDKCLFISSGQIFHQSNQPNQAKIRQRCGADLSPECGERMEKPFIKVKPLNSLMVPQVPVVSVRSFGLLISNHCVGPGSYQGLSGGSRNCSAQSITHLSQHNTDGNNLGGRSRNGNLQRKLAPLPHRPPQQQQQHQKSSKAVETTILSASATHHRIPPLAKNYKFLVQNSHVAPTLLAEIEQRHHSKLNVVKSATTRYMATSPTKHIFALPSLAGIDSLVHPNRVTGAVALQRSPIKSRAFRSEVIGRSISAAVTQKGNPI